MRATAQGSQSKCKVVLCLSVLWVQLINKFIQLGKACGYDDLVWMLNSSTPILKKKKLYKIAFLMLLVDDHYRNLNLPFCEIWGFPSSVAEDAVLLGCDTASVGEWFLTFQRVTVPSSSGSSALFLDQLTLQMKGLQSFRILGTSHPTILPNHRRTDSPPTYHTLHKQLSATV